MSSYHSFLFQHTLDPSGRWTAHLNLGDTYIDTVLANAWYVDWVRIWTENSNLTKQFNCNMGAWLGGNQNHTIVSNCQEMDESNLQRARRDVQVLCKRTQTNSGFHILIFQAGAEQDFVKVGFNDDIRLECREDQFSCEDGITCIPWEQICDGFGNCPQHENGNGGEDEVNLLNPKHFIVFS